MSDLVAGVFARGAVRDAVSDDAWLRAMLQAEAALARAAAETGIITPTEAAEVEAACDPGRFDVAALGAAAAESGNPVVPLVGALRETAPRAHLGATSQDIVDTSLMLLVRAALP